MPANGITINMPKIQLSISLYIDKIKSKNFLVFLKKMPFYTWRPFNFKGLFFRVGNYLKVYRNSKQSNFRATLTLNLHFTFSSCDILMQSCLREPKNILLQAKYKAPK